MYVFFVFCKYHKYKTTPVYLLRDSVHDCGSLNRTDVPLNLSCPTALRKSASGNLSLVSDPNNLQWQFYYIWKFTFYTIRWRLWFEVNSFKILKVATNETTTLHLTICTWIALENEMKTVQTIYELNSPLKSFMLNPWNILRTTSIIKCAIIQIYSRVLAYMCSVEIHHWQYMYYNEQITHIE